MDKLRVGVIGAGYLGQYHAEKYAGIDAVELVGVADIRPERAKEVAFRFNTQAFFNHRDLIGKVDAVSIVVSTPAHFHVSRDFLEDGVDVLIEKPMTTSLEEADQLLEIADNRGLIIQVGHLERFNPAVVALRGTLKTPKFIESHRLGVFKNRCSDVSVVLDLMIHDIDIILNFVMSEVQDIRAAGTPVVSEHVDIANARLEFANHCVANVTASRISTRDERKIRLFQKDAYISVDFANHNITIIRLKNANGALLDPSCRIPFAEEQVPNGELIPGMEINQIRFDKGDALEDEIRSFVNAVNLRQPPEVTGQMGRDALKIALSIMDQIRTHNTKFAELQMTDEKAFKP